MKKFESIELKVNSIKKNDRFVFPYFNFSVAVVWLFVPRPAVRKREIQNGLVCIIETISK